jgi:predicted metal-dependent hydrolase
MSSLNSQLWKGRQTIQYGNTTIEYDLVKSKRVKTSEIIVDENKILIRTPFDKSQFEIDKLLEGKAKWILDKQREYKEHQKKINKPTFNSESTLPYLGRNYPLKIYNNSRGESNLKFHTGKFEFSSRTDNWSETQIKDLYEGWLDQKAQKLFSKKVREYSKELKVDIHKIVVKNLKNRWGSVTKEGVVNLNMHLLKAPNKIIDYIIVHELCHILIKGHSYRFWNLVRQIIPDYRKSITWLEKNASSLIE